MAINFPDNPNNGDTITLGDKQYVYSSAKNAWAAQKQVPEDVSDLTDTTNVIPEDVSDLTDTGGLLSSGVTVYATVSNLPSTGNTTGDMAFVSSTRHFYIHDGNGWYSVALVNESPTAITGVDATYDLAVDGTPTVVTAVSSDPEGIPLTWSYAVTSGSLGTTAAVLQGTGANTNQFTITPGTNDPADEGSFDLTFSATEGVNTVNKTAYFSLSFSSLEFTSYGQSSYDLLQSVSSLSLVAVKGTSQVTNEYTNSGGGMRTSGLLAYPTRIEEARARVITSGYTNRSAGEPSIFYPTVDWGAVTGAAQITEDPNTSNYTPTASGGWSTNTHGTIGIGKVTDSGGTKPYGHHAMMIGDSGTSYSPDGTAQHMIWVSGTETLGHKSHATAYGSLGSPDQGTTRYMGALDTSHYVIGLVGKDQSGTRSSNLNVVPGTSYNFGGQPLELYMKKFNESYVNDATYYTSGVTSDTYFKFVSSNHPKQQPNLPSGDRTHNTHPTHSTKRGQLLAQHQLSVGGSDILRSYYLSFYHGSAGTYRGHKIEVFDWDISAGTGHWVVDNYDQQSSTDTFNSLDRNLIDQHFAYTSEFNTVSGTAQDFANAWDLSRSVHSQWPHSFIVTTNEVDSGSATSEKYKLFYRDMSANIDAATYGGTKSAGFSASSGDSGLVDTGLLECTTATCVSHDSTNQKLTLLYTDHDSINLRNYNYSNNTWDSVISSVTTTGIGYLATGIHVLPGTTRFVVTGVGKIWLYEMS